jgi:hypothetical protein
MKDIIELLLKMFINDAGIKKVFFFLFLIQQIKFLQKCTSTFSYQKISEEM